MQTIEDLLAECELGIKQVKANLSSEDFCAFEELHSLADECLEKFGISLNELDDQDDSNATSPLVQEIQELEELLHKIVFPPKTEPKKDFDCCSDTSCADTASSTSQESDGHAKIKLPIKASRKRNRQVVYHRHEERVMWDCFERDRIQTHVDRHRVARLFRQEKEKHIKKCVQARMQTVSKRPAKPLELLPQPKSDSRYLTKFQHTPLRLKLKPRVASSSPRNPTCQDVLLSVYLEGARDNMTRLFASSIEDLRSKTAYKLKVDKVHHFLRETAQINSEGIYTKFIPVRAFSQISPGDIICVLQSSTNLANGSLWKKQLDTQRQQRAMERNEHERNLVQSAVEGTQSFKKKTTKSHLPPRWDYNGRVIGYD